MLFPASPLHIWVDDEHPVLSLSDACRNLLLEQLLHLAVLQEIFILALLMKPVAAAEVICALRPERGEPKCPGLQACCPSLPLTGVDCMCVIRCMQQSAGGSRPYLTAPRAGSLQDGHPRADPPQGCQEAHQTLKFTQRGSLQVTRARC